MKLSNRHSEHPSPLLCVWQQFRSEWLAVCCFWVVFWLGLFILLSPLFSLMAEQILARPEQLLPPAWMLQGTLDHLFGTDEHGRDLFFRILSGTQYTVGGAVFVVLCALPIGAIIGISSAVSRGVRASVLNHLMDLFNSIPSLLLVLALVALLGNGFLNCLFALILIQIPRFIRASHDLMLKELHKDYAKALRLDGIQGWQLLRCGLLFNLFPQGIILLLRTIAQNISVIAAMGFLGLGAQAPQAEWGLMLREAHPLLFIAPWGLFLPGIAIFLSILVFNLLANQLIRIMNEELS